MRFNASGIEVVSRIDKPVDPQVVEALLAKLPDFKRAYSEDGIAVEELDAFGPTVRTLRQLITACRDLPAYRRDSMPPNPDVTPS